MATKKKLHSWNETVDNIYLLRGKFYWLIQTHNLFLSSLSLSPALVASSLAPSRSSSSNRLEFFICWLHQLAWVSRLYAHRFSYACLCFVQFTPEADKNSMNMRLCEYARLRVGAWIHAMYWVCARVCVCLEFCIYSNAEQEGKKRLRWDMYARRKRKSVCSFHVMLSRLLL